MWCVLKIPTLLFKYSNILHTVASEVEPALPCMSL